MMARHLVSLGATLRAGDPRGTGCSNDWELHGPSAFAVEYIASTGYRITLPGTMGRGGSLSNCMEKANIRV